MAISPADLQKMYWEEDKSQYDIANELGVTQWKVAQLMRAYNIPRKPKFRKLPHRLCEVDHHALDDLTPKAAWVVGWLLSDGFVYPQAGCFGLKLSSVDIDVLEDIRCFFGYTGPILRYSSYLERTGNSYETRELKISSPLLLQTLSTFELTGKKTEREVFPQKILDTEDEQIIRNFIKGVFEGDGSIMCDGKSSVCFQIVGTKELLTDIQECLMRYVGVGRTKLTHNTKVSNHYALRYRGRFQAMGIFNWIYKGSRWHLKRKYEAYLEIKRKLEEL